MTAEAFIERNTLSFSRSQDEIVDHITANDDMFGWTREVLCPYLDLEHCRPYLKEGTTEWTQCTNIVEAVHDFMSYFDFAWEKANDEREISASRSVEKLAAWAWLLGRDDVCSVLRDDSLYAPYGKPALSKASRMLGLPDLAD